MVRGSVLVDSKPVKNGAQVRENSIVETKEESQATLLLGKGTAFYLSQNSKMVVTEFGVTPSTGEEKGSLDLKFGRTRALVLNKGIEKRDLKIKARAATMGVRGTEVFISNPVNNAEPIEFFTLEGTAEVRSAPNGQGQMLGQGQGLRVASRGGDESGPQGGSSGNRGNNSNAGNGVGPQRNAPGGNGAGPGGAQNQPPPKMEAMNVDAEQVREQIRNEGMAPPPAMNFHDVQMANAPMNGPQGPMNGPPIFQNAPDPFGQPGDTSISSNNAGLPSGPGNNQGATIPPVLISISPHFCPVTAANCP